MIAMVLDANIIGKPAFGEHQIHDQWLETRSSCIQFHTSNL